MSGALPLAPAEAEAVLLGPGELKALQLELERGTAAAVNVPLVPAAALPKAPPPKQKLPVAAAAPGAKAAAADDAAGGG